MSGITLAQATALADATLARAREMGAAPMTVAVLDPGGHPKVLEREDGAGILRADIAVAKAWGALGLGMSTRLVAERAPQSPNLIAAFGALAQGRLIPAAGGVLIRDAAGTLLGAAGVSGDQSDTDEACVLHGIEAAGLIADLEPPSGAGQR